MRLFVPLLLVAACGSDPGKPMSTKTFGGDRPADLKTPTTLTPGKDYPLVVLLHGFTATGFAQSALFQMNALTTANAALWIAPDGTVNLSGQQFWNAGPECCDRDNQNPDDVTYLGSLVDEIKAEWPIDDDQVFFIGHSNGGYMSYRMALERADMIAGIMALAGDVPTVPGTPTAPVSVLHLHGTLDATVPYAASAIGSVETWAMHDGCTSTARTATVTLDLDTTIAGSETKGETTTGCPAGVGVELWTMEGSSHIPILTTSFATTVVEWLTDHAR